LEHKGSRKASKVAANCAGERLRLNLIQSRKIGIKQHPLTTNDKDILLDRVGIDGD
jgi:hypothetical protein